METLFGADLAIVIETHAQNSPLRRPVPAHQDQDQEYDNREPASSAVVVPLATFVRTASSLEQPEHLEVHSGPWSLWFDLPGGSMPAYAQTPERLRSGAGTNIAAEAVVRAPPDG
jgi:hypothetical protein